MRIRNEAFKKFSEEYDNWFVKNDNIYKSELEVFKRIGISGISVEIGVGSGKFALPLGIKFGVEPTRNMYERIKDKILIVEGVAERLPLKEGIFDWTLMVTTICFVSDPVLALKEMFRVLKRSGKCAVGFVDKDSPVGKFYQQKKDKSRFYYEATFFSSMEVVGLMESAGFKIIDIWQTLCGDLDDIRKRVQVPLKGYGQGSFVVVVGEKDENG